MIDILPDDSEWRPKKTGRIIMLDPEKLIKQCVKGKDEVVIEADENEPDDENEE